MEKQIVISYKVKYQKKRYLGLGSHLYQIQCFDSPKPCVIPEEYAMAVLSLFFAQLGRHSRPFSITLESFCPDQEVTQDES